MYNYIYVYIVYIDSPVPFVCALVHPNMNIVGKKVHCVIMLAKDFLHYSLANISYSLYNLKKLKLVCKTLLQFTSC